MALPINLTTQQNTALRTRLNTLLGNGSFVCGLEQQTLGDTPESYYVGIVDNNAAYQFKIFAARIEVWRQGVLTWLSTADTTTLRTAIAAKETADLNAELVALLT